MTDSLTRFAPFELRADEDGDGLTLEGYAAVFDSPTRIDSWEGDFTETIARGAFAKTISERTPVLQFDHGTHPVVGSIPLGDIRTLREDDHGLFVSARLHDNWMVTPVRDAIASGAVDGMSFRFAVIKDDWVRDDAGEHRTLREVRLHELGPVVFPAYDDTDVGVRGDNALPALIEARMAEHAANNHSPTPDSTEDRSDSESPSDDEGAGHRPEPPTGHSGMTREARARAFALLDL